MLERRHPADLQESIFMSRETTCHQTLRARQTTRCFPRTSQLVLASESHCVHAKRGRAWRNSLAQICGCLSRGLYSVTAGCGSHRLTAKGIRAA